MDMFTVHEQQQWMAALQRSCLHDWFHLPFFHALAEERGEGEARLFVFEHGNYLIALPLLLRPLHSVPGLEAAGRDWKDASSVYGYPGPFASHPIIPEAVIREFQEALAKSLKQMNVVSVFSRLHPIIPQAELLDGIGECFVTGRTVSIDLTLPERVQRQKFRYNHRSDIKRLHQRGLVCIRSTEAVHRDAFVEMYYETMHRKGADPSYFFERGYFDALANGLEENLHLFVCLEEGRPISGELVTTCNGIVQYYLSATFDEFRHLAPSKMLIDSVRKWASERGDRVLHLGGGVGAHEDSLFRFKAGFSDCRHDFVTWRWILQPSVYKVLCEEKEKSNLLKGLKSRGDGFFPLYRCATEDAGKGGRLQAAISAE